MTEHDIQNAIRMELSKLGFVVFRANVGKFKLPDGRWFDVGLPKGFSDLLAIKDGRVYFLEVKDATGKASKEQVDFIKTMRSRYGCVAGVVRSVKEALALVSPDFWEIDGDGDLHCPYCGNVCTSSVEYNTQDFNCCPKCGKPVNFY